MKNIELFLEIAKGYKPIEYVNVFRNTMSDEKLMQFVDELHIFVDGQKHSEHYEKMVAVLEKIEKFVNKNKNKKGNKNMKKLNIKNVHNFAKKLYDWNKNNGYNLLYSDCISYVFELYKENKMKELIELLSIDVNAKEEKADKVQNKVSKKATKKATKKQQPKEEKEQFELVTLEEIEKAIQNLSIKIENYDVDNSVIEWKIKEFLLHGYETKRNIKNTDGEIIDTVYSFEKGYIYHKDFVPYRHILDSIKDMADTKDINKLQVLLLTTLESITKKIAWNMLETGYNSRSKAITEDDNYYKRNGVSITQNLHHKYEVNDIVHSMMLDSLRLDFKMFENTTSMYSIIKFRLSNALRVLDHNQINGKKVSEQSFDKMKEDNRNLEYKLDLIHHDQQTRGVSYYKRLVEKAGNLLGFTQYEKYVFLNLVLGFSKKEINEATNKRNDRTFKSIEKKIYNKIGLTLKDMRKEMDREVEAVRKKQAIKRKAKKEAEAI